MMALNARMIVLGAVAFPARVSGTCLLHDEGDDCMADFLADDAVGVLVFTDGEPFGLQRDILAWSSSGFVRIVATACVFCTHRHDLSSWAASRLHFNWTDSTTL